MPLGVVNDSDFETELSKINNSISSVKESVKEGTVIDINRGRGTNNLEVPDSLRQIIGEESEINGRREALALAKQFGISPSSVSAYSNGATSTSSYDESKDSIKNHINQTKERVSKKAQNRLILALNSITPEKLNAASLRDASTVARNMSAIVRDMEPEREQSREANSPQFIIYSPQFRKEEYFETIIVKE